MGVYRIKPCLQLGIYEYVETIITADNRCGYTGPRDMTHLPLEIGVTGLSRDKFTLGNIHGYVKKKKETAQDIFDTKGKRSNQVSSFDTDMKPQKKMLFSTGFFRTVERKIYVDMADFRFRWQQQEQEN